MNDARAWRTHAIGAAVVLSMVGGFYAMGMAPSAELRAAEADRRRELTRLAADLDERTTQVAILRADVARVEEAVTDESIALTSVDMLTSRLARIAAEAEQSGLLVDELRPSAPELSGLFERVTITVTGSGRWGEVSAFMDSVHEQLRDTAVIGVEIEASARSGEPARFELTLRWYAEPAAGPGVVTNAR